MGTSAIVSVGDELLAGRIVDGNAAWLSRRLREEGFPVAKRDTVGDEVEPIATAVRALLPQVDVVVVGGGLGPTADDLTRDGLARALGVPLGIDGEAENQIREFLERSGRALSAANRVQAMIPQGAKPLRNSRGTAPGIWVERAGHVLVALPGVPHELHGLLDDEVLPRLRSHPGRGRPPRLRRLTVAGMAESDMGRRLADLMARGRNPALGSYPATGEIGLVLEATAATDAEADALLARDVEEIRRRLGPALAAEDGVPLAEAVGRRLLEQRWTIGVAESLTGGRVSDLLVSVPGISAVFLAGLITYGNAQKHELLGVPQETFRTDGAVSELCARQMAEGVRRATGAVIGLATTGIAGPTGAVPGKPVGTVFAAVATEGSTMIERRQIPGDRMQVRERAALFALDLLRRTLLGGVRG